ncbi:MAG TPA: K(+)-transporting ATPase subunit C [Acidimicrobiia bacterium]|jgi:K+-transporting ATPase ATPase C chain
MRRQLMPALRMLLAFTILTGLAYPLLVTGVAQVGLGHDADGSLIDDDAGLVGSGLLGQVFSEPQYFHSRPSAAGGGYDGSASSGSNLGPSSPELLDSVAERVSEYRSVNGLGAGVLVPIDAVTASASGLDPHISSSNATLQAARVAEARRLDVEVVLDLIRRNTDSRGLGLLGEPGVNVLRLNLALDALS